MTLAALGLETAVALLVVASVAAVQARAVRGARRHRLLELCRDRGHGRHDQQRDRRFESQGGRCHGRLPGAGRRGGGGRPTARITDRSRARIVRRAAGWVSSCPVR